jgi:hypothetical protein
LHFSHAPVEFVHADQSLQLAGATHCGADCVAFTALMTAALTSSCFGFATTLLVDWKTVLLAAAPWKVPPMPAELAPCPRGKEAVLALTVLSSCAALAHPLGLPH